MPTRCKGRSLRKCQTRKCKYVYRDKGYCRHSRQSNCVGKNKSICHKNCKWASGSKYHFCRKTKNRSKK